MTPYEFSPSDNAVLAKLSRRVVVMSVLIFLGGVGSMVNYALGGRSIWVLVEGLAFVAMAIAFVLPSGNFRRIATTTGKDIHELTTAFREMDRAW